WEMQDAIRHSEQAVRAMYARRYGTWLNIRDLASDNDQLSGDYTKVDDVFTNVAIIRERSTWAATTDTNHVPPFGQGAIVQVAWDKPTQINAALMPGNLKESRMDVDGREKDHMPILIRAWAYILSKRWTVLIHEAQLSQSWSRNVNQGSGTHFSTGNSTIEVDIGEVEADAAQRWSVLFYQMMVAGTRLFKARMARSCIFCGLSD
ncbi:hypothetical protein LB506_009857, partial [Fusarium annulatum]